jgi:hypothetical protein
MPTQPPRTASDLEEQAIALARQLGHMAGTMEKTAEGWLTHPSFAEQLTRVRDGASRMLESLSRASLGRKASKANRAKRARRQSTVAQAADASRAPGKRRRKPAPTVRGAKKSDERIPKMRTAAAVRKRRKSYA